MKWLRYYLEYCPSSPPPSFLTVLSLSIWSRLARGRQGSEALLYWSRIDQQGQRCPCESTRLIEDIKPLPRQTVKYSPSFPEDVWSCFFISFSLSVLSPLSFFFPLSHPFHTLYPCTQLWLAMALVPVCPCLSLSFPLLLFLSALHLVRRMSCQSAAWWKPDWIRASQKWPRFFFVQPHSRPDTVTTAQSQRAELSYSCKCERHIAPQRTLMSLACPT